MKRVLKFESTIKTNWLRYRAKIRTLIVVLLFFMAIAVRIYYFNSSYLVNEVQYRAALIARGFYFEHAEDIPQWRLEVNEVSLSRLPTKEPSITEYLASLLYRVTGGERLWIARSLTTTFWITGGIFLYFLTRTVISETAAIPAIAYYLFLPLGIHVSISFMSDSLMLMLFIISLFSIVYFYERPSLHRLLIATIISGLCILVRPLCVFAILGVFCVLAITNRGDWRGVFSVDVLIFTTISLAIGVSYYIYGIVTGNSLAGQAERSFIPTLLLDFRYWRDWFDVVSNRIGLGPLIIALFGLPLLRQGIPRALLVGLWIGYAVLCLVFTRHIIIAGYYHLQVIVAVAISLSVVLAVLFEQTKKAASKWYWWIPVMGAFVLVGIFYFREIRSEFSFSRLENPATAREIGEIVNHSDKVVYVASYYGRPLEYLSELSGTYWPESTIDWQLQKPGEPKSGLGVEERFEMLSFEPEYFVITDLNALKSRHADLNIFLNNNCSLLAENDQYLIYEKCVNGPQ